MSKEKLPINITFEIVQHDPPNDHWYDVTPILYWKDEYSKRGDTAMCLEKEIEEIKEAICLLFGKHFNIRSINENREPG